MKDWYFYQEQGKTMGPLTASDLRARIRDGRLRLFDLIYKEGEPGWRMALEHPDLRDEFKAMNSGNTKERPWVCLHRKNEQSFDFITLGPYSEEEVRSAVRGGKLSYADYIWRDEFTEWRRIGSLEEFNPRARKTEVREKEELSPEQLLKSVVELKRGKDVIQGGVRKPSEASTEDLTKPKGSWDPDAATRIVKSKAGEEDATRIVPRHDSDTTRIVRKEDPEATRIVKKEDTDATRIVKKVDPDATRIVTKNHDADATRIVRASNPEWDATRVMTGGGGPPPVPENTATKNPRVFRRSRGEDLPEEEEVEAEDDGPGTQTIFRRRRRKWKRLSTDWAIVGGLVICLALVIVIISQRMGSKSAPDPIPYSQIEALEPGQGELTPPTPEGIASLPPLEQPEAKPVPPVPTPPPAVKPEDIPPPVVSTKPVSKPPTQLVLNVQGANSSNARIEVRSNGSSDHPVYVQIIGLPGQVSEGASFYKFLRLKPTGNPSQPLDLGDIRLPQGRFVLRAETGDLKKQATLNLGVGEAQFKQAVAKERKVQSGAVWQERMRLFKLTQNLESALKKALEGKRFSSSGMDSLNVLKKANGGNYILFDDWWEAKEIVQDAKQQVTPALLERAKKLNDRIASFSVWRNK